MADIKNIAIEIIGIPILIIGILTIFTDWPFTKISVISFACGVIITFVDLLRTKVSEKQPTEAEKPAEAEKKGFPWGAMIGIAITVILVSILIAGVYNIAVVKQPAAEKIVLDPEISIHDFSNKSDADKIKSAEYANTYVENREMVVKTEKDDISAAVYFDFNDLGIIEKFPKNKSFGLECTLRVSGGGRNAIGGHIEDGNWRTFIFDGQTIRFYIRDGSRADDFDQGFLSNGIYKIKMQRIVNGDNSIEMRIEVISEVGESGETYSDKAVYYRFTEENPARIGLDFYSDSRESEMRIIKMTLFA